MFLSMKMYIANEVVLQLENSVHSMAAHYSPTDHYPRKPRDLDADQVSYFLGALDGVRFAMINQPLIEKITH